MTTWTFSANTSSVRLVSAAIPTFRLDKETDTLYLRLRESAAEIDSVFDDEEVFVFKDQASGHVVSLVIPNYQHYWAKKPQELSAYLQMVVPEDWGNIITMLFSATNRVPSLLVSQ